MKIAGEREWTEDRVREFWNHYSAQPHSDTTYFSKQVGGGIVEFLRRAGVLHGKVLDYGCGPGFLCQELLRHDVTVAGCDWSEKSVELANQRFRAHPRWSGAVPLGRPETSLTGPFQLITCIETIEHVPARAEQQFLAQLRSLLASDGVLFVSTPNAERLEDAMVYCPFCDTAFHPMQHVRSFTAQSLRALLEEHEFDVQFVGALHFGMLQPPSLPNPLDLSARAVARAARRAAQMVVDRIRPGEDLPSMFKGSKSWPHLCALARRRS